MLGFFMFPQTRPAPDIKCPYCGGEMEAGASYLEGTWVGFLLYGFSHDLLWFRAGNRKEAVIPNGGACAAHRCLRCRAVTILPSVNKWEEQPKSA